jgi:hypothetical protein
LNLFDESITNDESLFKFIELTANEAVFCVNFVDPLFEDETVFNLSVFLLYCLLSLFEAII